ncbi:MAG: adenosylcobinamide-phosphate synthase CbiB [Azospirillaceae bacterium]
MSGIGDIAGLAGLALAALAIDLVAGDPAAVWRRLPHPVVLIGRAIGRLDAALNRDGAPEGTRIAAGGLVVMVVVGVAALSGWAVAEAGRAIGGPLGFALLALVASTLVAARGLHDHVAHVGHALGRGLGPGREAVSHIVGRDPARLDEGGISRAAIESAAENFSDGVTAPLFWLLVAGLPGLAAYKAVNTLDSMIGHRTARHHAFGRVAARLDDLANLIPARATGLLFVGAAALGRTADGARALRVMARDARHHRSPNAGWPEAAMAGALGLRLAGPRVYPGHTVEDRWIGDGTPEATAADIRRALALYRRATGVLATLLLAIIVLAG